jgi:hypothetical protein
LLAVQVVASLSLKVEWARPPWRWGWPGAQQHGLRTLVVDLDPQANATIALDVGPTAATVAEVLDEPRLSVLRAAIAPSGWGEGLDVMVGAEQTERHNHPEPSRSQVAGWPGRWPGSTSWTPPSSPGPDHGWPTPTAGTRADPPAPTATPTGWS